MRHLAAGCSAMTMGGVAGFLVVSPGLGLIIVMALTAALSLWLLAPRVPPSVALLVAAAGCAPAGAVRVVPAVTVSDVLLVLAVAALLLEGANGRRALQGSGKHMVVAGLTTITLGALLSSLVNADAQGVSLLVRSSPVAAFTALVVWMVVRRRAHTVALAAAYAVGAATSTLAGQLLGYINPVVGRSYGLGVDSNHFAFSCALAVAMAGYAGSETRSRGLRVLMVVAGAGALAGVLLSGSRAGVVGAAAALAFVAVPVVRAGVTATIASGTVSLGGIGALMSTGSSTNAVARLFGSTDDGALSAQLSDDSREVLLQQLLTDLAQHPVVGVGWSRIREAHIHLLQVALGAGVMGLVGYLLVITGFAASAWSLRRCPRAIPAAGAPAAFVAMGLGQNILWDRYVWMALGISLAVASITSVGDRAATLQRTPSPLQAA